jgi:hypothetical protein
MLTNPRIRPAWRVALVVLAGGLLATEGTHAQQPLLPNMTASNRQRVPSCNENPLYKLYRQQFYGYYPTCWRQFPKGWGCPSPEPPNVAAAMAEIKRDIEKREKEETGEGGKGEGPAPGTKPPGNGRSVPLPEEGPSPFEMPGGAPNPPDRPGDAPANPAARPPAEGAPVVSNPEAAIRFPDRNLPPSESAPLPPLDLDNPPALEPGKADTAFDGDSSRTRKSLLGGLLGNMRVIRR